MKLHLEGLGIVGGIIAWHLHKHGVPFTWNDTDERVTAWRASTGAIYPSGNLFDQMNYEVWREWMDGNAPWGDSIGLQAEQTGWWYCTKAAPHGAKYPDTFTAIPLKRSIASSFHFNAQRFVPLTRTAFSAHRRDSAPAGSRLVVTHGFGARLHHYVWGWTRRVKLRYPRCAPYESHARPSFYFRRGRFVMAYAYAVPGEDWWYAGSHLLVQKKARSLDMPPKYEQWRRNFLELGQGCVEIAEEGGYTEGWRPAGAKDDTPLVEDRNGVLHVKPFWNSGIRHSPLTVRAVLNMLGVT